MSVSRIKTIKASQFADIKNIIVFITILSLLLIIGGYFYYKNESNSIKQREYKQLQGISNIKITQIKDWMNERLADAKHFSQSSMYRQAYIHWVKTKDPVTESIIKNRNKMIKDYRGFESIYIIDKTRKKLLIIDSIDLQIEDKLSLYIDSAFLNGKIYFTDFYHNKSKNQLQVAIIAPIIDKSNFVISCYVFLINPKTYFFPLIQSWPIASKTSETMLIRRDNDSVMVLNELKHFKNDNVFIKGSVNDFNSLIAKAGIGYTGMFEGKDYRGKDVLANILKISDTQWVLITKVDKSEIFTELKFRGIVIIIIVFVLIVLIGLISGWYYLYKKNSFYRTLLINEKRIRKIEEEYRTIFYSVGDAVISIDINGFIKNMNHEAERLTGWLEIEATGLSLEKVFKVVDDTNAPVNVIPQKNNKESTTFKFSKNIVLISKTGIQKQIDGSSSFILNSEGVQVGVVIVFKDHTTEREAQHNLQESENRLKRAEYISKSGNWELHLNNLVMHGSLGAQRLYELDYSIAPLKEIQNAVLPEYRDMLDNALKNLIEKDEPYDVEFKIKQAKSGNIIDIHSVATYDKQNRIIFGVIRDITDIKQNESLLFEKDLIFQSLMEYSPVYIFFKDHNIRAIYLSKNYEQMLGMPLSEILGKTMDEIFPSDLAKSMIEDDKKIIREGKLVEVDEELNGRYYTTIKFPILREGYPPMLAGFTLDLTDKKLAEKEMIRALEKAEKSDKLKDAFLQNMSHEIRTPMNAIIGFSELLQSGDMEPDKIENYTSIIINSSNQLLAIVDDILTVSRIQMGQEIPNLSIVDINKLFNDIVNIFKPKTESVGLKFIASNLIQEPSFTVETDSTKLTQIINNLLNNAIKFTHKGSVELTCFIKDNFLEFVVKDSGIGIKHEMQKSIFDRFIQADISISKKYGGTGLGLSICKAYVELLGGTIWVLSEPEKGSEFHFNIRIKRSHPLIDNDKNNVFVKQPHTKTILVAEDEMFNFMLIDEVLNYQYNILKAVNGREALEITKNNPNIDLVLMDIKMPEMDGETAMKEIKKIRPELPIVAQTAYALDDEKNEFMKSGFDDYITKPIKRNELILKVSKYLK